MNSYLILDLEIHELEPFQEYIEQIPRLIEKYLGRYMVRGDKPTVIEGNWSPQRVVVIEFPSRKDAENFLSDPESRELFTLRHKTTTSKLVLVDGCT